MEHKPAPAAFQNDTRRGWRAGRLHRNRLFDAAVPGYFSLAYSALASEWKGFLTGNVLMEHKPA